jgi:hypothetical protein
MGINNMDNIDYYNACKYAEEIKKNNDECMFCNCIVRTKRGVIGITDPDSELINGKQVVYTLYDLLLCDPKSLMVIGYLD